MTQQIIMSRLIQFNDVVKKLKRDGKIPRSSSSPGINFIYDLFTGTKLQLDEALLLICPLVLQMIQTIATNCVDRNEEHSQEEYLKIITDWDKAKPLDPVLLEKLQTKLIEAWPMLYRDSVETAAGDLNYIKCELYPYLFNKILTYIFT